MSKPDTEKFEFQAEIKQVLDIVVNSLYTEKEIFVRELVSNASDALEKFRHLHLTESEVLDDQLELEVKISTDEDAGTITIEDSGVGMTREEMIENLGMIAHSGSKKFLKAVADSGEKNNALIGQFGVGFYSAFMVAEKVSVYSRSWHLEGKGHCWSSDGSGSYEIEEIEGQSRGSKVIIALKEECKEFSKTNRIKSILTQYSSFVPYPIKLGEDHVNTVQALWLRSKKEIKDEEYTEFYKYQANAFDEPRYRMHFSADAPLAINSLVFVPKTNPENFGFGRSEPGVALYCRKILIESQPKDLLPEWLRFLKGVVDSDDLPLNISRETMQDRSLVQKLNQVITKRFLKFLGEEAKKREPEFLEFYKEFSVFLKEGVATDFTHRSQLAKLLRFESSITEEGKVTSLDDYISRMKDGQEEIYYLIGAKRESVEGAPYMEAFKARSLEVLYLYEAVDEFVMNNLTEFEGKKFVSADQADVKLDDVTPPEVEGSLKEEETKGLCEWLKEILGDKVGEVKDSTRLVDSPALVLNADGMSAQMRHMMKAMKQDAGPMVKVNFEINPRHPLIVNLNGLREGKPDLAKLVAEQVFDNSMVSAGLLEDSRDMVNRVYKILETVSEK